MLLVQRWNDSQRWQTECSEIYAVMQVLISFLVVMYNNKHQKTMSAKILRYFIVFCNVMQQLPLPLSNLLKDLRYFNKNNCILDRTSCIIKPLFLDTFSKIVAFWIPASFSSISEINIGLNEEGEEGKLHNETIKSI